MAGAGANMKDLEKRMEGAIAAVKAEFSGLGLGEPCRTHHGRRVWLEHAGQPGRLGQRA